MKERHSPYDPYREKARGKETRRVSLQNPSKTARAHRRAYACTCTYAEAGAAAWYYRDKTSFETKYDAETDGHDEPSWISDAGRGRQEAEELVSYRLDGDETARDIAVSDKDGKPAAIVVTDDSIRERRKAAALRKAYRRVPACAETLKGIFKHGKESEATICDLMKSND